MTRAIVTPRVSIVIPTYRRAGYLREAIESALAQTYRDFEVIVTDNDASHETELLVNGYREARLRYRSNERNLGAMANAVAGYREARGAYIGTLHDDDAWEPEFLASVVPPLESDPDLVVGFTDYWHVHEDGRIAPELSDHFSERFGLSHLPEGTHRPFYRLALAQESVPFAICAIFRKDAVDWDDIRLEADPCTDRWFNYLLSRTGRGAYYVKRRLTRYRYHEGSLSSGSLDLPAQLFCVTSFLRDERLQPIHAELRAALGHIHTTYSLEHVAAGDRARARSEAFAGVRLNAKPRALAAGAVALLPGRLGRGALRRVRGERRRRASSYYEAAPSGLGR